MPLHERPHSHDDGDEEPAWRVPVLPAGARYDGAHRRRAPHRKAAPLCDGGMDEDMRALFEGMKKAAAESLETEMDYQRYKQDELLKSRQQEVSERVQHFRQELLRRIEEAGERMRHILQKLALEYGASSEPPLAAVETVPAEPAAAPVRAETQAIPSETERQMAISLAGARVDALRRFMGYFAAARGR